MPRTRRKSTSKSRKNKSSHSYFMRGCARRSFFAKGLHGKLSSKKCKCVCHLNKNRVPECKCNCNETNKVFEKGTMKGGDALQLSLAYTGKQVHLSPSPYAAYVGKGGMSHNKSNAYPVVKETPTTTNWINSGSGTSIKGGANGLIGSPWSGGRSHRRGCGCGCGMCVHSSTSKRQYRKQKKMHRGGGTGGLLPQNLVNVGRNVAYNLGASNNEMNGYAPLVHPLPYKQEQLITNNLKFFNL